MGERVELPRDQLDQRGFSAAVRTHNRGVLPFGNFETQVFEDSDTVCLNGRLVDFEQGGLLELHSESIAQVLFLVSRFKRQGANYLAASQAAFSRALHVGSLMVLM